MQRHNTEPLTTSSQATPSTDRVESLTTWQSSSSFGSTAPDVRRAEKVFDQIENLLTDMMIDPEQRQFHCRVLEGHLSNEQPPKVFTAVVIINPPLPKRSINYRYP